MEAGICKATEEQEFLIDRTRRDQNKSFPVLSKGSDSLLRSNTWIKE